MIGSDECAAVMAVPPQIRCGALPDPSGLLAAIINRPDEDTPRLVYADWLDEQDSAPFPCARCNGKGKIKEFGPYGYDRSWDRCPVCEGAGTHPNRGGSLRAELIRVQCEMSHIERSHDATEWERCSRSLFELPEWYKDWGTLDARRSTLMLSARSALSPTGLHDTAWSRGFIGVIRCTWADWAKHGDALRKKEWVPLVRLSTNPIGGVTSATVSRVGATIEVAGQGVRFMPIKLPHSEYYGAPWIDVLAKRYPGTAFELPTV